MPTPVGPLGPGEFDPNDADLWDWNVDDDAPRPHPRWIRITAWSIAAMFVLVVVVDVLR